MRDTITTTIGAALDALGVPRPETGIHLERPANREHGDWSTNVAMTSAKRAGKAPRDLAQELVAQLQNTAIPHLIDIQIAGPGFINFTLDNSYLYQMLAGVLTTPLEEFGQTNLGQGTKVLLEFVSANPTGPLHAGHGRGAAYGDSLARILRRAGFVVTTEFYLNDRGTQMENFARSLVARRDGVEPPEGGYHGEYIVRWAKEMPTDVDPLEWGYARALADQRATLAEMSVHFDSWFSERSLLEGDAIRATLADLTDRDMAYEQDGAVWLRSTAYGDDKDRVLKKSDGEPTYLLPDLAYHRDKFARGYDLLINVWGADHHGYVARMKAGIQALGNDPDKLEVELCQLVSLQRDGEPVKLSKRSGDIIELGEVIDEVGADAARLTYLLQSIDSAQVFDFDVVVAKTMDNPVFYVQMAHARLCSLQAMAQEQGITFTADSVDFTVLQHPREIVLLRMLDQFAEAVQQAAADRAPHKVTTWAREFAGAVHGFYHDCPILRPEIDSATKNARLGLAQAARLGLAASLGLLGVDAPERM